MKKAFSVLAIGSLAIGGTAMAGEEMWSIFADSEIVGTFDTDTPGTFNPLSTSLGAFHTGLSFDSSGNLYSTNLSQLFSIDRTTGAPSLLGSHGVTVNMQDLAWNGSTMYGTATDAGCGGGDTIYEIDTTGGAATLVCTGGLGGCSTGLAVSGNTAYIQNIIDETIYAVDLGTCTQSVNGVMPFDANFSQGMTISENTGTGYLLAFNNVSFVGEFYTWDVGAGTFSFVGNLGGGGTFNEHNDGDIEGGAGNCLNLSNTGYIGGQSTTWTITGGTPGQKGVVVYGFNSGNINLNNFPAAGREWCAVVGIAGVNPSKIVGNPKVLDGNGEANWSKTIPLNQVGNTILTQALGSDTCPDDCHSAVDSTTVL